MSLHAVARPARHTASALLALGAAAAVLVATSAPAGARPLGDRVGGASRTSSVTMVPVDPADTVVNWSSAGFFPDYPWPWAQNFTLRSDYWTGGAADCTATLYYSAGHNKFPVLATASFHVED